ncbi:MAG: Hsp33 family molecular chaperone HslO [Alphaproteobacteria bacterium]
MSDNFIVSFLLHDTQVRGRMVRLGSVVEDILERHDYPEPVSRILGEMLVMAALRSSNLKQEGIFTLEIRGSGAVRLMVADAVFGGIIRGYAELRENAEIPLIGAMTPRALLGADAYLAITIDPGEGLQRYQGIVALEGETLADAFHAYFRDSVQLAVDLKLAIAKSIAVVGRKPRWRASGILIERLPGNDETLASISEESSWHYARVMLATLTHQELLDAALDATDLLYRLFHEQGVVVYPVRAITSGCRCSRARITKVLTSMPESEREAMVMGGVVRVHCQFCNQAESFTPQEIGL